MSLFFRGRGPAAEARMITNVPWATGQDPRTSAGSAKGALRLIPLYGAVASISESVASLPLHAYRDRSAGRERLPQQPSLVTAPGGVKPGMSRMVWLQQCMTSLLLRGNAYGLATVRDGMGYPTRIDWIDPGAVSLRDGDYFINGRKQDAADIVHVPALTLPGSVVGLSPLQLFRMQIETGLGADKFAGDWFKAGVAPIGHFRNSNKTLTAGDAAAVKDRFRETVANRELLVTGNDWEYKPLSISPDDAQWIEAVKLSATQVATIYRVPPEDIGGESGGSLTYSTVELNGLRYAQRTILPWTTRLEQAINPLLPRGQYVKFNLDALARADLKSRMEAHQLALVNGLETNSEARAMEDRPPLTSEQAQDWQDKYGKRATVPATSPEGAE